MLRDWLDELEKIERDTEAGNGQHRPHSSKIKRHLSENNDDYASLNSETGVSNFQHEDKTNKRSRSESSATRKVENPSLCCDSGFFVLNGFKCFFSD